MKICDYIKSINCLYFHAAVSNINNEKHVYCFYLGLQYLSVFRFFSTISKSYFSPNKVLIPWSRSYYSIFRSVLWQAIAHFKFDAPWRFPQEKASSLLSKKNIYIYIYISGQLTLQFYLYKQQLLRLLRPIIQVQVFQSSSNAYKRFMEKKKIQLPINLQFYFHQQLLSKECSS